MKLIMLRGLPASGKTTRAKQIVENGKGTWVRINRDFLREMLHSSRWSPQNEDITIKTSQCIAQNALRHGWSVVIDDTNITEKHKRIWMAVAKEMGAKFEVEDVDTDMDTCIERNRLRDKTCEFVTVPPNVIVEMALKSGRFPRADKRFVLCDIDGTLADISHRQYLVNGEKKDWKTFFKAMGNDRPRNEVIEHVGELYRAGHSIFLLSGRPDDYRKETEMWLAHHVAPFFDHEALFMRKSGDTRPDTEVKADMLTIFGGYTIDRVIDDRPSVIRMWRENGLSVEDVGDGIEF